MELKRNLTMLTDFYELTMMNGYAEYGLDNREAVFDLFYRAYDESNFCIAAGLEQAIEYIENLHFEEEDIEFLREKAHFSDGFLERLRNFRFTGERPPSFITQIPKLHGSLSGF